MSLLLNLSQISRFSKKADQKLQNFDPTSQNKKELTFEGSITAQSSDFQSSRCWSRVTFFSSFLAWACWCSGPYLIPASYFSSPSCRVDKVSVCQCTYGEKSSATNCSFTCSAVSNKLNHEHSLSYCPGDSTPELWRSNDTAWGIGLKLWILGFLEKSWAVKPHQERLHNWVLTNLIGAWLNKSRKCIGSFLNDIRVPFSNSVFLIKLIDSDRFQQSLTSTYG